MFAERRLRIAQIAPPFEPVPPPGYGGTERVVSTLTEELVRRGHDVTLFASGDSQTSANLVPICSRAFGMANPIDQMELMKTVSMAHQLAQEGGFDAIHEHNGYVHTGIAGLELANTTAAQTDSELIQTNHNLYDSELIDLYQSRFRHIKVASISNDHGRELPFRIGQERHRVVYNGVNWEGVPFSGQTGGPLIYMGRITPDKGVHYLVKVAEELGMECRIAARPPTDERDIDYFNRRILPFLNGRIQYIGEVKGQEREELLCSGGVFGHFGLWDEPFGLGPVEATGRGTPAVALNRGALPEIIQNGVNGYIVRVGRNIDGTEEGEAEKKVIAAITKRVLMAEKLDRRVVMERTRGKFNAATMADGYEEFYLSRAT